MPGAQSTDPTSKPVLEQLAKGMSIRGARTAERGEATRGICLAVSGSWFPRTVSLLPPHQSTKPFFILKELTLRETGALPQPPQPWAVSGHTRHPSSLRVDSVGWLEVLLVSGFFCMIYLFYNREKKSATE